MPSYFYHLKFELYPTENPAADSKDSTQAKRGYSGKTTSGEIWLPPPGADIFDELPSHSIKGKGSSTFVLNRSHSYQDAVRSGPATAAPLVQLSSHNKKNSTVIDCGTSSSGTSTSTATSTEAEGKRSSIPERPRRQRTRSLPPAAAAAALAEKLSPRTAVGDWRFGQINIETIDLTWGETEGGEMAGEASTSGLLAAPSLGPSYGGAGTANKAECLFLKSKNTDVGWGVVHFYREGEEVPTLGDGGDDVESGAGPGEGQQREDEEDFTTLCIPAVPAYMTAGDFLGFVGEKWRKDVSHCRMVMTSRMNRYLALLKFRSGERAKQWRKEFDGRVFNTMEPQICHVVFIKSISFETPSEKNSHDHITPNAAAHVSNSMKPFPPPTPNLVELPTCPVCLERMDETNGLMTIPCSHVFHCTCLQNWKGAGCPVCRFTNASQESQYDPANPYTHPFGSADASNLCTVCDCADDLWICLICGYLGCGRYKGGHAKDHWKETAHSFALELETQHVWDYAGDMWVHRLIRDKGDGKVVELPGRGNGGGGRGGEDEDVVPRQKLESIGLEYTHLITSQLESQRAYYEEMISKVVDKAAKASTVAEGAAREASATMEKMAALEKKYDTLSKVTIPQLERDVTRETSRASKSEILARNLSKSLQEEKKVNEGLMKRIEFMGEEGEKMKKEVAGLRGEAEELREMNRDLSMFISGQEKLREMEREGEVEEGEVEGASVGVGEKKGKGRRRKR